MVKPLIQGTPPELEKKANGRVTMIRKYELITPLFGGGVKANEVDVDNPIRGTAVRGHLRFWWRATRGLKYAGDWEKLKAKEDEIWGSTSNGSKIAITVLKPECRSKINVNNLGTKLTYAAFPLIEANGSVYEDVKFNLRIDCPTSLRPDLRVALWAWETFGGIGARTRRGFGALHCTVVDLWIDDKKYKSTKWEWRYSCENTAAEIVSDAIDTFKIVNVPPDSKLPGLSRNKVHTHCTPLEEDPMDAWQVLIDSLKNFRQSRNLKETYGNWRPFSRSHWPEPEAIRDLTGQTKPEHQDPIDGGRPIVKFPRAAFGLPIVFEFKDDDDRWQDNPSADPRKTELKGADHERRASKLILRPLKCTDGYVGLATILHGQTIPPGGLGLKNSPKDPPTGAENLTQPEAKRIRVRIQTEKKRAQRLNTRANYPDYNAKIEILQAFLDQLP